MNKINFTNLPDQTTPVNATNMNQLQTNVDTAKVENESNRIDNVDANDYVKSGFYYLGTGCSNVPQTYIRLIVSGSSTSGEISQFALSTVSHNLYVRRKSSNIWTSWASVGYQTLQINNIDVNTIICGIYYCNASCTNVPSSAGNGYLISYELNSSYAKQFYYAVNGLNTYERVLSNGTWSNWVDISSIKDVSNSYGKAVKFPDGTMICYLSTTNNNIAFTQYGGSNIYLANYAWTFPVEFYSTPVVTCSKFKWGTSASWGSVNYATTTEARLYGYDINARATGTEVKIDAIAIGRWKA